MRSSYLSISVALLGIAGQASAQGPVATPPQTTRYIAADQTTVLARLKCDVLALTEQTTKTPPTSISGSLSFTLKKSKAVNANGGFTIPIVAVSVGADLTDSDEAAASKTVKYEFDVKSGNIAALKDFCAKDGGPTVTVYDAGGDKHVVKLDGKHLIDASDFNLPTTTGPLIFAISKISVSGSFAFTETTEGGGGLDIIFVKGELKTSKTKEYSQDYELVIAYEGDKKPTLLKILSQ